MDEGFKYSSGQQLFCGRGVSVLCFVDGIFMCVVAQKCFCTKISITGTSFADELAVIFIGTEVVVFDAYSITSYKLNTNSFYFNYLHFITLTHFQCTRAASRTSAFMAPFPILPHIHSLLELLANPAWKSGPGELRRVVHTMIPL